MREFLYRWAPNLYKYCAIAVVWGRDKYYQIFAKNKEIEKYKNMYRGKRCFIVATGPSLTIKDLEKLENEYTFGVNSITKIFSFTKWRPTYYCIGDPVVYESVCEDLEREVPKEAFFAKGWIKSNCESVNWYNPLMCKYKCRKLEWLKSDARVHLYDWSNDAAQGLASGESIVYTVLQLAVYMGFEEIYLLGTDCDYTDKNNLHSGLMQYQYKAHLPLDTGTKMLADYQKAKEVLKSRNVKIYNATRGGMLEVFPRVDLDKILNNGIVEP